MLAFLRTAAAAVAAAALLGGCGLAGGDEPTAAGDVEVSDPVAEGAAPARERVQHYLDAMRAKDVDKGRRQLCPVLHAGFDQSATGANGDFGRHFTVPAATIVSARPRGGKHEVVTSVTVSTGGRGLQRSVLFTVARDKAGWCIDGEVPVAPPRAPSASPTASPAG